MREVIITVGQTCSLFRCAVVRIDKVGSGQFTYLIVAFVYHNIQVAAAERRTLPPCYQNPLVSGKVAAKVQVQVQF